MLFNREDIAINRRILQKEEALFEITAKTVECVVPMFYFFAIPYAV